MILTQARLPVKRGLMSDHAPAAVLGIDHVGVVGADLDALARAFSGLGFHLTPFAAHASGRTGNRCAMFRDGGYLELMATVPGESSATLDRFLARGAGGHVLALEIGDEGAAAARLGRAGITGDALIAERDTGRDGAKARFAAIMPPDQPEGRVLLIRQLTRALLWRPDNIVHANGALALTEAVYASGTPAETMTRLSRLTGRPAVPDPLGGYCIPLPRGCVRVLPRAAAEVLFPGATGAAPLIGVTIAIAMTGDATGAQVVHAGGLAIRFSAAPT
jgi:hypothetical protein